MTDHFHPDDDPQPLRLTFGARAEDHEERMRELVSAILAVMDTRPNPWANRSAAYDPAWDWRLVGP